MILCDSGPVIASAVTSQPDHHVCVELFTSLRLASQQLLVPATVVAEVGFMIEKLGGSRAETAFLRALASQDFEPVDLRSDDYARMADLTE